MKVAGELHQRLALICIYNHVHPSSRSRFFSFFLVAWTAVQHYLGGDGEEIHFSFCSQQNGKVSWLDLSLIVAILYLLIHLSFPLASLVAFLFGQASPSTNHCIFVSCMPLVLVCEVLYHWTWKTTKWKHLVTLGIEHTWDKRQKKQAICNQAQIQDKNWPIS